MQVSWVIPFGLNLLSVLSSPHMHIAFLVNPSWCTARSGPLKLLSLCRSRCNIYTVRFTCCLSNRYFKSNERETACWFPILQALENSMKVSVCSSGVESTCFWSWMQDSSAVPARFVFVYIPLRCRRATRACCTLDLYSCHSLMSSRLASLLSDTNTVSLLLKNGSKSFSNLVRHVPIIARFDRLWMWLALICKSFLEIQLELNYSHMSNEY